METSKDSQVTGPKGWEEYLLFNKACWLKCVILTFIAIITILSVGIPLLYYIVNISGQKSLPHYIGIGGIFIDILLIVFLYIIIKHAINQQQKIASKEQEVLLSLYEDKTKREILKAHKEETPAKHKVIEEISKELQVLEQIKKLDFELEDDIKCRILEKLELTDKAQSSQQTDKTNK